MNEMVILRSECIQTVIERNMLTAGLVCDMFIPTIPRDRDMIKQILPKDRNRLLVETSKLLNSTLDLDELLDIILRLSSEVMDAQASSLLLIDESTGTLKLHLSPKDPDQSKKRMELKMGEGIAGWVAQHGQIRVSVPSWRSRLDSP
jgi:transcriptional regulator with GAF, ATPase, and Fis domain